MIKGYSNVTSVNNLMSTFWCFCARNMKEPWFERVSSKANIADGVSRSDFSLANEHKWTRHNLDLSPLWPFLAQVAANAEASLLPPPRLYQTRGQGAPPATINR